MERHMIIRKWQVLRFLGVSEISIWGNILTNKTLSHYHPVCIFLLSFIPLLGISHLHSTHNHPTPPPTLNITISEKLTFRFLRKLAYFIHFFFRLLPHIYPPFLSIFDNTTVYTHLFLHLHSPFVNISSNTRLHSQYLSLSCLQGSSTPPGSCQIKTVVGPPHVSLQQPPHTSIIPPIDFDVSNKLPNQSSLKNLRVNLSQDQAAEDLNSDFKCQVIGYWLLWGILSVMCVPILCSWIKAKQYELTLALSVL